MILFDIFFLNLKFVININDDGSINNKRLDKLIDDENGWDKVELIDLLSFRDGGNGNVNVNGNSDRDNRRNFGGSSSDNGNINDGRNNEDDESDIFKDKRSIFLGIRFKRINFKGIIIIE